MKAVSDSSVLIALSTIGQLSLLQHRFPQGVLIPEAVWREVVEAGADRPRAEEVRSADWIQRRSVEDQDYVKFLSTELDEGEAEAIVLARQEQVDVILASIGLFLPALVTPFISLAIYLDSPGPIFYSQWRVGKGGLGRRLPFHSRPHRPGQGAATTSSGTRIQRLRGSG